MPCSPKYSYVFLISASKSRLAVRTGKQRTLRHVVRGNLDPGTTWMGRLPIEGASSWNARTTSDHGHRTRFSRQKRKYAQTGSLHRCMRCPAPPRLLLSSFAQSATHSRREQCHRHRNNCIVRRIPHHPHFPLLGRAAKTRKYLAPCPLLRYCEPIRKTSSNDARAPLETP